MSQPQLTPAEIEEAVKEAERHANCDESCDRALLARALLAVVAERDAKQRGYDDLRPLLDAGIAVLDRLIGGRS